MLSQEWQRSCDALVWGQQPHASADTRLAMMHLQHVTDATRQRKMRSIGLGMPVRSCSALQVWREPAILFTGVGASAVCSILVAMSGASVLDQGAVTAETVATCSGTSGVGGSIGWSTWPSCNRWQCGIRRGCSTKAGGLGAMGAFGRWSGAWRPIVR